MLLKNCAYDISCATTKSMVLVSRTLGVALGELSIKICISFAPSTTNIGN